VCQLGGATTDEVIIRNLPLHLADSARTWLEHLPASQIHNWDDLVRTFVANFQGMYVRPGNSWDLRACTQKPGESLRDFIWRFSKCCTELPSVAQSEIIHAEGSKSKEPQQKHKRGKKGKKPRREARAQGRDDDGDEALAVDPARRGP
jgi:hypothetical protein